MDLDLFLALPRWEILQIIAHSPSSPIEIAEKIGTTVSYVSQQLKLLEAKGLVKKTKTGAFQKGKPRNVFSISEEFVHLTLLTNNFARKKKILLDEQKKIFFRLWFLDEIKNKEDFEKLFLFFGKDLNSIDYLFVDISKKSPFLFVLSKEEKQKQEFDRIIKKLNLNLICRWEPSDKASEHSNLFLLYENPMIFKRKNLKGGKENAEN